MRAEGAAPRLPPNYRLVLEVVRSLEDGVHASAAEIFARARLKKTRLGYATVYRALDRLCHLGLVLEVHIPGFGAALYEPARSHHAHFVCSACGRVEDIDCPGPAREIEAVVAARSGAVDDVVITVNGRCATCRAEHRTASP